MTESSVADMEATPAVSVVAYSNFWPVPPAMVASGQPGKIKSLGRDLRDQEERLGGQEKREIPGMVEDVGF